MFWNKRIGVVGAMMFSACASSQQRTLPPPPPQPAVIDESARSVDSGMVLDAAQLDKFIGEADAGDGFAAFKLSSHFMSIQNDEQARYWLLYAAARGYPVAQYNLWFDLKDREDCKSKLVALAWLKSAALNGDKQAAKKIKEFAEIAQSCVATPSTG